jgi:hypothetical protein
VKLLLVGALLLALVGCGEDLEQVRAEAREGMVDECYKEQSEAFREAAETAQDAIQTYVPEMLDATADLVGAIRRQNISGINANADTILSNGEQFNDVGSEFQAMMSEAKAMC